MTLKIEANIHMKAKVRVCMDAKVSIIECTLRMPKINFSTFPKTTMTLKIEAKVLMEAKVHMEAKVRVSMEAKVSIIEAKVHMYPQNA